MSWSSLIKTTQETDWTESPESLLASLRPETCLNDDDSDDNDNNEVTTVHVPSSSEVCDLVDKLKLFAQQTGNSDMLILLTKVDDKLLLTNQNNVISLISSRRELFE